MITQSGAHLVRFKDLSDIFYYDNPEVNPEGLGMGYSGGVSSYLRDRLILTPHKQKLIQIAQKGLSIDRDFLELVYKAKSDKRKYTLTKFGGNLSMAHFAAQNEKCFKRQTPGAKKITLDMAFQVGTFMSMNYEDAYVKILKTILMCQALNIKCNIDVFDSDTAAYRSPRSSISGYASYPGAYVICNIASSDRKLDMREILATSDECFFRYTLFNGYSALGSIDHIGTFLPHDKITKDLGEKYDVIGGNMLTNSEWNEEESAMVHKIFKIAWK